MKEAISVPAKELSAGQPVYVWGTRQSDVVSAKLVAIGGNRVAVGTISSIQPLTNTVGVREIAGGRDLDVKLLVTQLYRTAPIITTPTEIKTPAGVPLLSVGFGELKEGDSVLVIGSGDSKMTHFIRRLRRRAGRSERPAHLDVQVTLRAVQHSTKK